jgi:hypothetical protein
LFCYNVYVKDIYITNKLKHFEHLLIKNGFILSEIGDEETLSKEQKDALKKLKTEYDDALFDEFLNASQDERQDNKYKCITEHIKIFNLYDKTNKELKKIKDCIMNKFYFNEILNYNRLLKDETYIIKKINSIHKENYNIKCYDSSCHKVKLLFDICKMNNMNVLNFECNFIEFPEATHKYYKTIFNAPNSKIPTNKTELIKLLVDSYKSLMPTLEIIGTASTRPKDENGQRKRIYTYKLDDKITKRCNKILKIYGFNEKEKEKEDNITFIDESIIKSNDIKPTKVLMVNHEKLNEMANIDLNKLSEYEHKIYKLRMYYINNNNGLVNNNNLIAFIKSCMQDMNILNVDLQKIIN